MKKILSLFFIVFLAVGCSSQGSSSDATRTIKYKDQTIEVKEEVKSIAVFDIATLDMLDTLGVEVAGVATSIVPEYLKQYRDEKYLEVGGSHEPDLEVLSSMQPDLVILSGRTASAYDAVKEIAPTILIESDNSNALASYQENATIIGELVNKQDEVAKILADQEVQIEELKGKVNQDLKTLVVLTNDKELSVYGKGSRFPMIHDILEIPLADENIEVSTHGQNVNLEYIAKTNPDVIYVLDRNSAVGGEKVTSVLDNALVEKTNAHKNDAIKNLDPQVWYLSGLAFQSFDLMIEDLEVSFTK